VFGVFEIVAVLTRSVKRHRGGWIKGERTVAGKTDDRARVLFIFGFGVKWRKGGRVIKCVCAGA